jgi:hypothetical protein
LYKSTSSTGDTRRRRSVPAIWTRDADGSASTGDIGILGRYRRSQLFDQRQVPLPCWE